MSIVSELNRLQQAKSDLAASITNKGVTVSAATTIDGYAALVDQIQTGGGSVLPDGAIGIEYLESNGTQYINTGVKGSSSITVKLKCLYYSSANNQTFGFIFGSRVANGNKAYNINHSYSANWRFGNYVSGNWVNNTDRVVVFDNTAAANVMKVYDNSDTLITTLTANSSTFSNNLPMYIFGMNGNGSPYLASKSRIYSCKIYLSGYVICNMIPVRVGQIGYMYDKVSETLFGNAGTGSFILGPDIT